MRNLIASAIIIGVGVYTSGNVAAVMATKYSHSYVLIDRRDLHSCHAEPRLWHGGLGNLHAGMLQPGPGWHNAHWLT